MEWLIVPKVYGTDCVALDRFWAACFRCDLNERPKRDAGLDGQPKNSSILDATASRFAVSHSQITSDDQPIAASAFWCSASRWRFLSSLGVQ